MGDSTGKSPAQGQTDAHSMRPPLGPRRNQLLRGERRAEKKPLMARAALITPPVGHPTVNPFRDGSRRRMVYLSNSMSKLPAKFLPIALIFAATCASSGAAELLRHAGPGAIPPQAERTRHGAHDRGPSGRRTHRRAGLFRARPPHAHRLPLGHARRGRPEPDRPRAGRALGLIRTQELLAARRIDGAEQFFTRAIDFGFTKTASETLEKWGHDRILGDIVWVIRSYRPDVVILCLQRDAARWPRPAPGLGDSRQGGLHRRRRPGALPRAVALRPALACRAAGASRGFRRASGRGAVEKPPVAEPPPPPSCPCRRGGYRRFQPDPRLFLRGTCGAEPQHAPQPGHRRHAAAGAFPNPLRPAGRPARIGDLFDGIDSSWNRLPGGAAVGQIFAQAVRDFEPAHPEKAIPLLAKARPLVAAISDPLARLKLAELDEALARCAGLWVEAQAHQPEAIPGADLAITTTVLNRSSAEVTFESARIEGIWNQDLARQARPPRQQSERGCGVPRRGAARPALLAALLAGEASLGRRVHGGRPAAHRPGR